MKILHVTPVYAPAWNYGGPPRSISALCEGLSEIGVHVDVLTTNANKTERLFEGRRVCTRNKVNVTYEKTDLLWPFIYSIDFIRKLRSIVPEYDLVHVTGIWQPVVNQAYSVSKKHEIPYVISPRGTLSNWSFQFHGLRKKLYWLMFERQNVLNADAIHYTSQEEYEDVGVSAIKGVPYFVIPNSVNFGRFGIDKELRKSFRKERGYSNEDFVVGSIGRIHPKKKNEYLIRAIASLSPRFKLLIVGEPKDQDYINELKELAKKLKVKNRVQFHGHVDGRRLNAVFNSVDMFALPTDQENFGMSIIEAIYMELPVVTTPNVNIAKELEEESLGRIVPQDENRFAEKIREIESEYPRDDLSRRKQYVKNRFSKKSVAKSFKESYRNLINHVDK